jgi:hypothetical protein
MSTSSSSLIDGHGAVLGGRPAGSAGPRRTPRKPAELGQRLPRGLADDLNGLARLGWPAGQQ